ncbi:glycosyltransferase [Paucibacter sp. B2R-40]|uniref:glycosyltransferase n=1 Tax=Paucibacter sp. B2R-40 TaxID=2893554 RepID=UPI0021E35939|nr:glycosyltransferase [Paucibacter sp. B2R-40]MCV2354050.1 glycosyltransferase [Paucibacter sp. B2R-40]
MIYIDVTDLILWVRRKTTVTGIQRVHINYAVNALDHGAQCLMFYGRECRDVALVSNEFVRFMGDVLSSRVKMDKRKFFEMCPNARLFPWPDYSQKYAHRPVKYWLHTVGGHLRFHTQRWLFERPAQSPDFKPGDALLSIGRDWTMEGYVANIQRLKDRYGIRPQLFLHDMIPIPGEKQAGTAKRFLTFVIDAFKTFDRFFTSSDYNRGEIIKYMHEFVGYEKPVVKLGFGQNINAMGLAPTALPEGLEPGRYLLCVGRVAASKNQIRLMKAWHKLVQTGADGGVKLVLLGELSGSYREFHDYLKDAKALTGKLILLEKASDQLLNTLYQNCLFTVFPSTIEGYGLPAAESVAYGKFCLASNATSIPEAAGIYADYFNPYDEDEMLAKLNHYLNDGAALQAREALIKTAKIRTWAEASAELLERAGRPLEAV